MSLLARLNWPSVQLQKPVWCWVGGEWIDWLYMYAHSVVSIKSCISTLYYIKASCSFNAFSFQNSEFHLLLEKMDYMSINGEWNWSSALDVDQWNLGVATNFTTDRTCRDPVRVSWLKGWLHFKGVLNWHNYLYVCCWDHGKCPPSISSLSISLLF